MDSGNYERPSVHHPNSNTSRSGNSKAVRTNSYSMPRSTARTVRVWQMPPHDPQTAADAGAWDRGRRIKFVWTSHFEMAITDARLNESDSCYGG